MRTAGLVILSMLVYLLPGIFSCSHPGIVGDTGQGGGSEVIAVVGTIVDSLGNPEPDAQVKLLPVNYNPVTDPALPDSMIDTTDAQGNYGIAIARKDSGNYNVSAVHLLDKTRLLRAGVSITADSTIDTIELDEEMLVSPGALRITLVDTIDTNTGYFYVPGTDLFEKLVEEQIITDESGVQYIIFDALPSGTLPGVSYNTVGSTVGSSLLKDSVDIIPRDTTDLILGNYTVVKGTIIEYTTALARNVPVYLVPDGHNPCIDPTGLARTGFTDSNGVYLFSLVKKGGYNLQSHDPVKGIRLLLQDIEVTGDTLVNPFGTLYQSGALRFTLPDTVDTVNGYVFIPGTMLYELLSTEQLIYDNGLLHMVFDSLPRGSFSGVYYGEQNSTDAPVEIIDEFFITEGDTTDLSISREWRAYNTGNSGIPHDNVRLVVAEESGVVWLGMQDSGLVRFDGSVWSVYTTGNSVLPHNTINGLCRDKEGSIWVGTFSGIVKVHNGIWTDYTVGNETLPARPVTDIAVDSSGNLWFGDSQGCIKYDGANWSLSQYTETHPMVEVKALTVDIRGEILVGARYGLFIHSQSGWDRVPVGFLIPDNSTIHDIAVDRANTGWCATDYGVFAYKDGTWEVYDSTTANLPGNAISSVAVDTWDNIWIGTGGEGSIAKRGVVCGTYTAANTPELQNAGAIQCIAVENENSVYFATERNGLLRVTFTR